MDEVTLLRALMKSCGAGNENAVRQPRNAALCAKSYDQIA